MLKNTFNLESRADVGVLSLTKTFGAFAEKASNPDVGGPDAVATIGAPGQSF